MIILILIWLGLCLGSFINALVWRLHEQAKVGKAADKNKQLSIIHGRSMCSRCKHPLGAADLIPLLSWVGLRGRCRYCHHKIEDPPLIEAFLPLLFVLSYVYWPAEFTTSGIVLFGAWLVMLVGLLALAVYDLRWMLLPNRIVYPLIGIGVAHAILQAIITGGGIAYLGQVALSVLVAGGIFYVLFQVSAGRWIGGGDVKLGYVLGLILASPTQSLLMLFLASLIGTIVSLPLLLSGKLRRTSRVPFGPFLIAGTIVAQLFGSKLIHWYIQYFL